MNRELQVPKPEYDLVVVLHRRVHKSHGNQIGSTVVDDTTRPGVYARRREGSRTGRRGVRPMVRRRSLCPTSEGCTLDPVLDPDEWVFTPSSLGTGYPMSIVTYVRRWTPETSLLKLPVRRTWSPPGSVALGDSGRRYWSGRYVRKSP